MTNLNAPSYVSFVETIQNALQVLKHSYDTTKKPIPTIHRTYVHAWADSGYPASEIERNNVAAIIYAAGSRLLKSGSKQNTVLEALDALLCVEHNFLVTDGLAEVLYRLYQGQELAAFCESLKSCIEHYLSQSDQIAYLKSRVGSPKVISQLSPSDRQRQLTFILENLHCVGVTMAARLLNKLNEKKVRDLLASETDDLHIIAILCALQIHDAADIALQVDKPFFREIVLARSIVEKETPATETAQLECLAASLNNPTEWSNRLATFAAWPSYPGHNRLMKPFGCLLANANTVQISAFFDAFPLEMPTLKTRAHMKLVLEGLFGTGGDVALNLFCAFAFERWQAWIKSDSQNQFYPPVSSLDIAVEHHIQTTMMPSKRKSAVDALRSEVLAQDMALSVNSIAHYSAHMRLLARYQPYRRAESSENVFDTEKLNLFLDLVGAPDLPFFSLRYNYEAAGKIWKDRISYKLGSCHMISRLDKV